MAAKVQNASTYFQDIAKKLLTYAETEYENGERLLYIRGKNLSEVLRSLKFNPNQEIGKLLDRGFLRIKKTIPEGYYLVLEGKKEQETILLSVARLQKLAKRIVRYIAKPINTGEGLFFSIEIKLLQSKLSAWQHDPDNVIPQLIDNGYLVARRQDNKIFAYWVFKTQKASKNSRFSKAA